MRKYSSPFVTPPWNSGVSVSCNNFVKNFNIFSQSVNFDGNCSDFFLNNSTVSSLKNKCTEALNTNFLNRSKSSKNFIIKISYTSIRSIFNKISFVEFHMCTNNIDLFFFTETWLNPNIINSIFCPSGYNVIRNDRLSRGEALLSLLKII